MITTKVLGYLSALLLILFLAALVFGFYERSAVAKYEAAANEYKVAQTANLATIAGLEKSAKATQYKLEASQLQADQASAEVKQANEQLSAALTQRTTARKVIYAKDTTAASWANSVVPDDTLTGLCRGSCGTN